MSETFTSREQEHQPTLTGLEHPKVLSVEEIAVYYDGPETRLELADSTHARAIGFGTIDVVNHGHPTLGHDRFWQLPQ